MLAAARCTESVYLHLEARRRLFAPSHQTSGNGPPRPLIVRQQTIPPNKSERKHAPPLPRLLEKRTQFSLAALRHENKSQTANSTSRRQQVVQIAQPAKNGITNTNQPGEVFASQAETHRHALGAILATLDSPKPCGGLYEPFLRVSRIARPKARAANHLPPIYHQFTTNR